MSNLCCPPLTGKETSPHVQRKRSHSDGEGMSWHCDHQGWGAEVHGGQEGWALGSQSSETTGRGPSTYRRGNGVQRGEELALSPKTPSRALLQVPFQETIPHFQKVTTGAPGPRYRHGPDPILKLPGFSRACMHPSLRQPHKPSVVRPWTGDSAAGFSRYKRGQCPALWWTSPRGTTYDPLTSETTEGMTRSAPTPVRALPELTFLFQESPASHPAGLGNSRRARPELGQAARPDELPAGNGRGDLYEGDVVVL